MKSAAGVRHTPARKPARQKIQGGTCDIYPLQVCLAWAAYREHTISWLAFKVWCAVWLIQKWRCKKIHQGQPYRFKRMDVCTIITGVNPKALDDAFHELETANILRLSDTTIWVATALEDVREERVKARAAAMFAQLHANTRTSRMNFPRRLLTLIAQCGQRIVRAATILGLLLRIMLVKRYHDYRGCVKAAWIAQLFGVSMHRVQSERTRLINEGLFRRLPTGQRVKNTYGEWVALPLLATAPATATGEDVPADAPPVELPAPDGTPRVEAPSCNQVLSSHEEKKPNQILAAGDSPGALQHKTPGKPTWHHIVLEDLTSTARSLALFDEAIHQGFLRNTLPDRTTFFATIAHARRVATRNACGLLRTIVEQGLWQVITQADEEHAIRRLRDATEGTRCAEIPPPELTKDALTVQMVTADLTRLGWTGDILRTVQRHGYLQDWTPARWMQAEAELAQACFLYARQQPQASARAGAGAEMATQQLAIAPRRAPG
jgi:hypothetical protein